MSVLNGTRPLRTAGESPDPGTWSSWIEVLEAAIAEYERQLAWPVGAREAPAFTPVPTPAGAGELPPALVQRTRAALAELEELTRRTQERRDSVAGQLLALGKVRRQQGEHSHTLGQAFDVCG